MGSVRSPDLVNLVMFVFSAGIDFWFNEVRPELEMYFGPVDYVSKKLDFQRYTYYYNEEMGYGIEGVLVSFERLIHPSQLPDIKLRTNEIELEHSVDGKRKVNIDPGYVHHTQFVLASTKPWGNRVYIGKGIYAEVTLMYLKGEFVHFDYTYPNYREREYKEELEKIRKIYLKKRRAFL